MKSSLSAVDLRVLSRELDGILANSRFDKAYSLANNGLRLRFHVTNLGGRDLVVTPHFVCISTFQYPQLDQPRGFAMALRKRLEGSFIRSIKQHEFDRILELEFEGSKGSFLLFVELFSKGNVILCDKDRKILALQKSQRWRDRILKPGREYAYPPQVDNPLGFNGEQFKTLLKQSDKSLAASIASMGLGGFYGEEVCLNAGLEKNRPAGGLGESEAESLYSSFKNLVELVERGKVSPSVVLDDGGYVDVIPFEFKLHQKNVKKKFSSFNEAVDDYFSRLESSALTTAGDREYGKVLGKLELMKRKQVESLGKLKEKGEKHRQAGDLIYQNLQAIEKIIEEVRNARKKGLSDREIEEKFALGKRKDIPEAGLFKKLDKNKLTLELD